MNAAMLLLCLMCGQTKDRQGHVPHYTCYPIEAWFAATDIKNGEPLPEIMLELRTAKLKSPSNALVTEGIQLIRGQVQQLSNPTDSSTLAPEYEFYPNWFFAPGVIVFGYVAWCLVCASLTRWWQIRRRRWLIIAGIMAPLALIPPINEIVRHNRYEVDRAAPPVVISKDTDLRTGNGPDYPAKIHLPQCVECRKIGERGDWLQVEFASGLSGWVERQRALVATSRTP